MSLLSDCSNDLERAQDELRFQRPVLAAQNEELLRLRQALAEQGEEVAQLRRQNKRQAERIEQLTERLEEQYLASQRAHDTILVARREVGHIRQQYEQLREIFQQALVQSRELCQPIVLAGNVRDLAAFPCPSYGLGPDQPTLPPGLCEHANEMPSGACGCPPNCYCKREGNCGVRVQSPGTS